MNFDEISVGIDIEEIVRFKNKEESFYDNIFTADEKKYCIFKPVPEQHFAVRFCAKEAFIKAVGFFGCRNVKPREIEVYHDENDCPQIRFEKNKSFSCRLSLSHDKNSAIACVIVNKTANYK